MRFTGKLRRLQVKIALPSKSFSRIAIANLGLRRVAIVLDRRVCIDSDQKDQQMFYFQRNDIEKWVVDTIGSFFTNYRDIRDIVIDSHICSKVPILFPEGKRITALDDISYSQRLERKVGVRVESTFYHT